MDVIYDCKATIPQNHSLKGSEGVNNFISLIMAFLKTYSKWIHMHDYPVKLQQQSWKQWNYIQELIAPS